MSSMQCRGGGGCSSGAIVRRSSTPHTPQRYRTLMRRISPLGGGGGSELVMLRNMPRPIFQMNHTRARPIATQTMVPNMIGCELEAFDDEGVGQTAAFAHRLQAVAAACSFEFVEQRAREARTRCAKRMTQGDCSTVDVDLLHVGV